MDAWIQLIIAVVGVPAVLVAYIWATEQALRLVSERWKPRLRPWLWIAPALILLFVFLVYPTIGTLVRSLQNRFGTAFVGLANYQWFFGPNGQVDALWNNVLWLVFLTLFTVSLGLLVAVLVDRVRYESFAKAVVFLPLAISMVAAGVIWRFMFDYQPTGATQIGTLNALLAIGGISPVAFLQVTTLSFNTFMLILVMTWMWTGFCMVIISAALKGINPELLEAARVDGATEWQVFRRITFPLLVPTLAVVATTMIITALKAFDIVYVMTSGNLGTQVIANAMYQELFSFNQYGRGAAIAIILLLAIVPVMLFNIRRFQAQEAIR
jgi:alpha-glucoside transport system permease protein